MVIGLEGRASARPGREESRPSAELINVTNTRVTQVSLSVYNPTARSLTPKVFGVRDDTVVTPPGSNLQRFAAGSLDFARDDRL
jgi:hypothetical protein